MRLRLPFLLATFAAIAAAAAAQNPADPDLRIVVRDVVKTARNGTPLARAYQGRDRGPEQTERFSRKVKVGRDGRVSVENIAGEITVTSGSGDRSRSTPSSGRAATATGSTVISSAIAPDASTCAPS
jgi:hypothetical protein